MSNINTNIGFFNLPYSHQEFLNFSQPSWQNYQTISMLPYLCSDQNFSIQPMQNYINYPLSSYFNPQCIDFSMTKQFFYPSTSQCDSVKYQTRQNCFNFEKKIEEEPNHLAQKTNKHIGAFTFCDAFVENLSLSSSVSKQKKTQVSSLIKYPGEQIITEEKKFIQNLRYQRKNIEANIVNKIYTYLKTNLKFGTVFDVKTKLQKEKSGNYCRILQKLEKAKKQTIKRQFLKGLVSMNESLPGYTKISKQLEKKGQNIQQFEYYIRLIIRNYLKTDARNSILTSKKMNSFLWIDHLKKIRQLQTYLFSNNQIQNQE